VDFRELRVPGAFEIVSTQFADDRGAFMEWFRADHLEAVTGRAFPLAQGNLSVSKKGVVRGIHFADLPPSQAKFISCVAGAVLDFTVDIRSGSPTFGAWESVHLNSDSRTGVFIPEGVGHAFVALTDDAVVSYVVTAVFNAEREHAINPLDSDIALDFPFSPDELLISAKDRAAPSLRQAESDGLLPTFQDALDFYAAMKGGHER
jgi:dTDP-4-dehydrorhamnose 3,5-epimerase